MEKKYYSWDQFFTDSRKIYERIGEEFDCIVGISRGGIFLAGVMSQFMDNHNVYLVSYKGGGEGNDIKKIKNIHPDLCHKKILLVDDLSDKGHTLEKVKTDLVLLENEVIVATLHCKPGTKLVPDHYASKETAWMVYPWEM